MLLTSDGFALTCAHVVENAIEIYVKYSNNTAKNDVASAELVSLDKEKDMAIIKLEDNKYFCAQIDDARTLPKIGKDIVILGYPFGSRLNDSVVDLGLSFTKGYVSSNQVIHNQKRTLLDISAKAGNSGSPVIDYITGKVIGILAGSYHGGVNNAEEINYMIPILYLYDILQE